MVAKNFTEAASKLCDREFCLQCDTQEIDNEVAFGKFHNPKPTKLT